MRYTGVRFGGMNFIPNFVKVTELVQRLKGFHEPTVITYEEKKINESIKLEKD
jgi:hypothetical protein